MDQYYSLMHPWGMPGGSGYPGHWGVPTVMPPAPVTPSLAPRFNQHFEVSTRAIASSDPLDMDASNPYPEISTFLHSLDEHHSKRGLTTYISQFDAQDYYNIDEVFKIGSAAALFETIGMTAGNAAFLLEKIKAEMKRIDRMNKVLK